MLYTILPAVWSDESVARISRSTAGKTRAQRGRSNRGKKGGGGPVGSGGQERTDIPPTRV